LGTNGPQVARKHYLQSTDEHFRRASRCDNVQNKLAEVHGNRTDTENAGDNTLAEQSGARSGALGALKAPVDVDLQTVIDAWPKLSAAVRRRIVGIVRFDRGRLYPPSDLAEPPDRRGPCSLKYP